VRGGAGTVREGSGRAGRRAGRGAGLAGGWPATQARGGGAGGREGACAVCRPAGQRCWFNVETLLRQPVLTLKLRKC
jgi:hypothetical protein